MLKITFLLTTTIRTIIKNEHFSLHEGQQPTMCVQLTVAHKTLPNKYLDL